MSGFRASVNKVRRPVLKTLQDGREQYEVTVIFDDAPPKEWWDTFKLITLNPYWKWKRDSVILETTKEAARRDFTLLLSAIVSTNEEYGRNLGLLDATYEKEKELQEELNSVLTQWKNEGEL